MAKYKAFTLKKEAERCGKLLKNNFRGMIRLKYLIEIYAYAPTDEWKLLQPQNNEILHGVKEGRRDAVLWWNPEKKQIECNRMGAVLWYCFCIRKNIPI